MVCAVCGRVLDHHSGVGYAHTLQDRAKEDHPAVPVPAGEVPLRGRCDFCNRDNPTWSLPAKSFSPFPGHMMDGDWAACDTCVEHIGRRDWGTLARKVARRPQDIPALNHLYRLLSSNITGDPTRLP